MIPNLVMTCAGGRMMPGLIPALREHRDFASYWGIDLRPLSESPFDVTLVGLAASEPEFAAHLLDLLEHATPAMLVLGADEEAEALAPFAGRFRERGILANLSSPNAVAVMRDKVRTAELVGGGFTHSVASVQSYQHLLTALDFPRRPVALKARTGRGRRDVYCITPDPREKRGDIAPDISAARGAEIVAEAAPGSFLMMPWLEGRAVTCDILASNGELVYAIRRDWMQVWRFPFPGQIVSRDAELEERLVPLCRALNLHGLVDADFIDDRDLGLVLLELNPRPSGSMVAAIRAGIPLLRDLNAVLSGSAVMQPRLNGSLQVQQDFSVV